MNNKAFDTIIHQKLHSYSAPVPAGLWDKIAAKDLSEPSDTFDEFVQHKLYHHTAEAPSQLWDKIQTALIPQEPFSANLDEGEEEKKRRRFIFWLPQELRVAASVVLVLLIGTVAAYLYNYRFSAEAVNDKSSAPVQVKGSGPANAPASERDDKLQQNKPQQNLNFVGKDEESEANPGNKENEDARVESAANNNKNASWKLDKKNKAASFKERGSVFPYDQRLKNISQNKLTVDRTFLNRQSEIALEVTESQPEEEAYSLAEKAGNAFIRQNKTAWRGNNHNVNAYQHASSFKNVIICPTDRKRRNPDWDLEVYISPDMAFKTVSNNSATAQLLNSKDSSESLRPGFTAGFRIVKPLNDYLSIKTGLQYSQINERFTYKTENETRTTTVVTVRSIVRAPGDTLIVRDTSTLTQVGFKTNTVKNRFRTLDIPVLASVQFGNDNLKWGITAGAIVNLSSWYEGVLLDSSLAAVAVGKDNGMMYKKNIGLGLYAGFHVTKRINYNTQIFFEPYFRYNLSNMTTTGAPFNQKFSIGGLAMGLRFNLNSR